MKKQLRSTIAKTLKEVSRDEIHQQSSKASRILTTLPEFRDASKIALYLHMDNELETDEMIQAAFAGNKKVFLPRIAPIQQDSERAFSRQKTHLEMLQVESLEQVHGLQPQGKYKIREPTHGVNCFDSEGLDMIVVPGVAFTSDCWRMGHGAGYYDAFIKEHKLKANSVPALIGVGLEQQLVESLPLEEHDQPLDAVVAGSKLFYRAARDQVLS